MPSLPAILLSFLLSAVAVADDIPTTGHLPPQMAGYDRVVPELMRKWQVPGMSVAVAYQGRLVLARGYGWADRERQQPVQPDSLFRIASVSKPLTAAAVLVLAEQGRLGLDDCVLDHISDLAPLPGREMDPRWRAITLRRLLHHEAGFDRQASVDPMFQLVKIAGTFDAPPPADANQIVRWMLGRPLDFDPGTRYVYSNFGYCLLGQVVERVSGMPYAEAVGRLVFEPCGIRGMRPGRSRLGDRAEGEVRYYEPDGAEPAMSVFADDSERVPWTYGGFAIEPANASGGWLASAPDLVRFAASAAGSRPSGLWKPETRGLVTEKSELRLGEGSVVYYGMGWLVRPAGGSANWWHNGSLPGTLALLVHAHDGVAWAALMNTRPADGETCAGELDRALWEARLSVREWPEGDLFDER